MWEDTGDPNHWSAIFLAPSGENSFSRRESDGAQFAAGPTALRIAGVEIPGPATLTLFAVAFGGLRRRRRNA
jgi:uncharacterized protein (TIGR03382 family)